MSGRAAIKPNFCAGARSVLTGLRGNPNAEVRIIGHTDSTGTDAINNPLSVERAASTRDYLVARGVNAAAFRIEGRGSREPVATTAPSGAGAEPARRESTWANARRAETAR